MDAGQQTMVILLVQRYQDHTAYRRVGAPSVEPDMSQLQPASNSALHDQDCSEAALRPAAPRSRRRWKQHIHSVTTVMSEASAVMAYGFDVCLLPYGADVCHITECVLHERHCVHEHVRHVRCLSRVRGIT